MTLSAAERQRRNRFSALHERVIVLARAGDRAAIETLIQCQQPRFPHAAYVRWRDAAIIEVAGWLLSRAQLSNRGLARVLARAGKRLERGGALSDDVAPCLDETERSELANRIGVILAWDRDESWPPEDTIRRVLGGFSGAPRPHLLCAGIRADS